MVEREGKWEDTKEEKSGKWVEGWQGCWEEGRGGGKGRRKDGRGAWMAQSVERPTSAQVMISPVREFEPRVGLCADHSEPGACFAFCDSLSL